MYAVVIFYPNAHVGLYSRTWREGLTDIQKAETLRTEYLKHHPKVDPQDVKVVTYRD